MSNVPDLNESTRTRVGNVRRLMATQRRIAENGPARGFNREAVHTYDVPPRLLR